MAGLAEVLEIDARRGRARVRLAKRECLIPMARLERADAPASADNGKGHVRVSVSAPAYSEIDLHGERVEQAIELAERALDQAVVHHLDTMKIIHGHGSGRVRLAVRKMLDTHPHVDSYRFGEPHEGGLACTVVRFRRAVA
jgi:DNA mismatch repair protein MutS2